MVAFSSFGDDFIGVKLVTTAAASGGGGVEGGGTLNRDFCESPNFPDEDDDDDDWSLLGWESEVGMASEVTTLSGVNPAGLKKDILAPTLLSSLFSMLTAVVECEGLFGMLVFLLVATVLFPPAVRSLFGEIDFRFVAFVSREVVVDGGGRPLEDAIVERAELGGSFDGAECVRPVDGNLGPSEVVVFPPILSTLVERDEDPPSAFNGFGFVDFSASISDSTPLEVDGFFCDAMMFGLWYWI